MAIRRLIVANRGEIAVRIFRTCARLGIETVAVVAPDDRGALHARSADANGRDRLVSRSAPSTCARRSRPGPTRSIPATGSSPRAATFAEAVLAAGADLGRARRPRRSGSAATSSRRSGSPARPACRRFRRARPDEIGFPLVVKAAAGRRRPGHAGRSLRGRARRGARRSSPRGRGGIRRRHGLLRALPRAPAPCRGAAARATPAGSAVLGARDCSIQRRHQKLVEESPAPGLDPLAWPQDRGRRRRLRARRSATRAPARPSSSSTAPDVYFLELNGRIQVEHPVTEEVTGLDIVELQLRVAAGERDRLDVGVARPRDRGAALRRGSA